MENISRNKYCNNNNNSNKKKILNFLSSVYLE